MSFFEVNVQGNILLVYLTLYLMPGTQKFVQTFKPLPFLIISIQKIEVYCKTMNEISFNVKGCNFKRKETFDIQLVSIQTNQSLFHHRV